MATICGEARLFIAADGTKAPQKKRAVFLSVIGQATYETLQNLVSPHKAGDKMFDKLVDVPSS